MANEGELADHIQTTPQSRFRKAGPLTDGRPAVLYFIAGAGLIKIGKTTNLTSRFRAIRNSSPVPLDLLATMPATLFNEMRMHQKFTNLRRHGEWFEDEGSIRAHIESLISWGKATPEGSLRTLRPCLVGVE